MEIKKLNIWLKPFNIEVWIERDGQDKLRIHYDEIFTFVMYHFVHFAPSRTGRHDEVF